MDCQVILNTVRYWYTASKNSPEKQWKETNVYFGTDTKTSLVMKWKSAKCVLSYQTNEDGKWQIRETDELYSRLKKHCNVRCYNGTRAAATLDKPPTTCIATSVNRRANHNPKRPRPHCIARDHGFPRKVEF